jgi:hypothetical protein
MRRFRASCAVDQFRGMRGRFSGPSAIPERVQPLQRTIYRGDPLCDERAGTPPALFTYSHLAGCGRGTRATISAVAGGTPFAELSLLVQWRVRWGRQ